MSLIGRLFCWFGAHYWIGTLKVAEAGRGRHVVWTCRDCRKSEEHSI